MIRKILLFVISGILIACTSNDMKTSLQSGEYSIKIEDPMNLKEILLSDFVDSISIVILETTNESVMSRASNIIFYHEQIFILDEMTQKILIFSNTGKFLKSHFKQGQGPEEYIRLTDFSIVNENIFVLDMFSRTIIKYDMDFNFIERIKLQKPAMNIAVQKNGNVWVYNILGPSYEDDFEITKVTKEQITSNFIKREHPKDYNVRNTTYWADGNVFHSLHGEIYYSERYGNQIFKLQDSVPSLYIDLNFGKYTIPRTTSVFYHENIFFSEKFPYTGKDYFFITDKYNIVRFSDSKGKVCYAFQDKETENIFVGFIKNNIISDYKRFIPIFANDNILIEPISIALVHDEDFKGIMEIDPSLHNLSEDDNFLLILYHLKR